MTPRWLMLMKRLAQNPPGARRVKLFLAVIAICVLLYLIERFIGWPDALTTRPVRAP